eukprot:CAMPEP_0116156312 /NCGR_PEP_ID=MMETSP0329-20121206/22766_1 /TAXON_ID=697910 /ORGANISM="Pseudo-nitzschia arenysensis, Strain B593" /LENGTH=660 /DNA_ID=CAMNT_0003653389 /DNA_START=74 /DNA_END=2057 /DNA_ORIENTATION=+
MREDRSHVDQESNDDERTRQFSQSQDEEEDDTLMVCRCETPKILYDLLQSFSKHGSWSKSSTSGSYGSRLASGTQTEETTMHKLHPMTVFCTKSGLTIHSQSSNKQFQASMELPASLFGHYRLMDTSPGEDDNDNDNDVSYDFTIHWQTFMQCLNLLMIGTGGDKVPSGNTAASFFRNHQHATAPQRSLSSLTLSYHTSTEVLRLEWEGGSSSGGNVVATAAIPGLNPPPADEAAELSAAFGQSPIVALPQAGHELGDTKELDYLTGATTVRLRFLRANEGADVHEDHFDCGSRLRLSAKGHSSKVTIEIPAPIEFSGEDDESINQTATKRDKIAHTYSLSGWKRALQPLDMARETCLSVNSRGILAIQHQLMVDVSGKGHRSKTKRRSSYDGDHHSQEPQHPPPSNESAFCDFLLLPLEVDEDRNDDDDSDDDSGKEEYLENDGDRTLTPHESTQGSLSQSTRDRHNNYDTDEDEEDEIRQSAARGKRRRRILSSTQDTDATRGDDDQATNASVRLPIGSDDDDDDGIPNDNEEAPSRTNLLFPMVTDGNRHDARGSSSSHHNRRRERERRKRQRRSHQPTSNLTSNTMSAESQHNDGGNEDYHAEGDQDNESQERSVNLLDDDEEYDQNRVNRGTQDSDVDDDDRYCSSPELVYGQQG